jgi:SAM-dependent methyltransferase
VLVAAGAVRRVVAVDVSLAMLDHLRDKLRRDGVDNVECVAAGFLTYEHRGKPADLVYSRYALHHLPDFWTALALTRIAEMLRPDGILRLSDVVYGFGPADAEAGLERWISTAASESLDDRWTRAELEEHVRDESGGSDAGDCGAGAAGGGGVLGGSRGTPAGGRREDLPSV